MFSVYRRGLDNRDCRLDVGFCLGDDSIPDDLSWDLRDRDKTAVWLEFIDIQFDECNISEVNNTESKYISNLTKLNTLTTNINDIRLPAEVCIVDNPIAICPTDDNTFVVSSTGTSITETPSMTTSTEVVCIQENKTVITQPIRRNVVTTTSLNKTSRVIKVEDQTIRR